MDGFNLISIDKDNSKSVNSSPDLGIEIIDEVAEKQEKIKTDKYTSLYLVFSFLILLGSVAYFVYLILYRISLISQMVDYSNQLRGVSENINLKEMEEFQTMDAALKIVNEKLGKHILTSDVLVYVNQNMRKSLQVTDYSLEVKSDNVEVVFTAVAPGMKEIAEQAERFFDLQNEHVIKTFSVVNTSYEGETKKIKFTMKITLDQTKVNAVSANQSKN